MLDQKRNTFFAHIPKTGGASIEWAHGFASGDVQYRHRSVNTMIAKQKELGKPIPDHFFTVKRNIFDRIKSTYRHFHRTEKYIRGRRPETYTFEHYINAISRFFENDRVFLKHELVFFDEKPDMPMASLAHIQPFSWWVDGAEGLNVLRFETLNADYEKIMEPITGLKITKRINTTPEKFASIPCEYTPALTDIVEKYYTDELG